MKIPRILPALTVANFALLLLLLGYAAVSKVVAADVEPVLRGRALEIVDYAGRLRATIGILPASADAGETVVFRLINADGQPSVKIATGAEAAGLSFVGGDDESYLILEAENAEAYLKIVEPEGREQTVSP